MRLILISALLASALLFGCLEQLKSYTNGGSGCVNKIQPTIDRISKIHSEVKFELLDSGSFTSSRECNQIADDWQSPKSKPDCPTMLLPCPNGECPDPSKLGDLLWQNGTYAVYKATIADAFGLGPVSQTAVLICNSKGDLQPVSQSSLKQLSSG